MHFVCICTICNPLPHVRKCIIYGIQTFHRYFTNQRHKSNNDTGFSCFCLVKTETIYLYEVKASRHFVTWVLSGFRCPFILKQEWTSTESKARISFIVTPLDLKMSICCFTNPNSFIIALMLAFPGFDCCGRALNYGRFTLVIVALSFSDFQQNVITEVPVPFFPTFNES